MKGKSTNSLPAISKLAAPSGKASMKKAPAKKSMKKMSPKKGY